MMPLISDFICFEIYCAELYADKLIGKYIPELIKKLEDSGLELFFYTRYYENGHHIRLRIKSKKSIQIAEKTMIYFKELYSEKTIKKIIIVPYKREIERYGKKNIEKIEEIFYYQSLMAISIIGSSLDSKRKLHSFIACINLVINAFTENENEKISFINSYLNTLSAEAKLSTEQKKLIKNEYNLFKNRSIEPIERNNNTLFRLNFNHRGSVLHLTEALKSLRKNELVFLSTVHMMVNRFFIKNQWFMEVLILDLIKKDTYSKL